MKRLLASLLAALALAGLAAPASAALTASTLGTGTTTAGAGILTTTVTTTQDAPPGSVIFLTAGSVTNSPISVTDNASTPNSYSCNTVDTQSSSKMRACWSFVTTDLPSGGTITFTFGNTTQNKLVTANLITGSPTLADLQGVVTSATSTAPAITVPAAGSLTYSSEILMCYINAAGGGNDGAITQGGGFTNLNKADLGVGSNRIYTGFLTVAANTAVSYSATLATSRAWMTDCETFTDTGAGATIKHRMGLLGVGN